MHHGDIDLGEHWLRQWLAAWWHQTITWTNFSLAIFVAIHHTVFHSISWLVTGHCHDALNVVDMQILSYSPKKLKLVSASPTFMSSSYVFIYKTEVAFNRRNQTTHLIRPDAYYYYTIEHIDHRAICLRFYKYSYLSCFNDLYFQTFYDDAPDAYS